MRRKIQTLTGVLLVTISLSGCGMIPELPELTEQQEMLITEYAAGLLLKYDNSYDNGILTEEALAKAQEQEDIQRERAQKQKELAAEYVAKSEKAQKEKEAKKESESESKNDSESNKSPQKSGPIAIGAGDIMNFVGMNGVSLEYKGTDKTKAYPNNANGGFSVDAGNGKELVVVKFAISNVSGDSLTVDMFNSATSFGLELPDGSIENSCPTLLLDDLSVYRNELKAGASDNVVLLFEVSEGTQLSGANLIIKAQGSEGALGL